MALFDVTGFEVGAINCEFHPVSFELRETFTTYVFMYFVLCIYDLCILCLQNIPKTFTFKI